MGEPDRIADLTEKQRECLRMVLQHRSSKEIARELGIGVDAVDQRLKAAMRKLGVNSRVEAAQMLAASEADLSFEAVHGHSLPRRSVRGRRSWLLTWLPTASRRTYGVVLAFALGWLLAATGIGESVQRELWYFWGSRAPRPASGEIVLVALDDRSIAEVGSLPWPRRRVADLLDRLNEAGVRQVLLNLYLFDETNPVDDAALGAALKRLDRRTLLPVYTMVDPETGEYRFEKPLPSFRRSATLVTDLFHYDRHRRVGESHEAIEFEGTLLPPAASVLQGWPPYLHAFPINYSIDPSSIPVVSAVDVLKGRVEVDRLARKSVVIGWTAKEEGRRYIAPGHGRIPRIYFIMMGAETLMIGYPVAIPATVPFALVVGIIVILGLVQRALVTILLIGCGSAGLFLTSALLQQKMIYLDAVSPSIILLSIGVALGWTWLSQRRLAQHRS